MIIYRCDRCKKDIDFGSNAFDGEECLNLSTELYNCPGVINRTKNYLLLSLVPHQHHVLSLYLKWSPN